VRAEITPAVSSKSKTDMAHFVILIIPLKRIKGYAWELFRLFAVVVNCLLGGQSCLANWAGLDFDDDWAVVVVDGCHPGAVERAF
jgi:hypothetical protein